MLRRVLVIAALAACTVAIAAPDEPHGPGQRELSLGTCTRVGSVALGERAYKVFTCDGEPGAIVLLPLPAGVEPLPIPGTERS